MTRIGYQSQFDLVAELRLTHPRQSIHNIRRVANRSLRSIGIHQSDISRRKSFRLELQAPIERPVGNTYYLLNRERRKTPGAATHLNPLREVRNRPHTFRHILLAVPVCPDSKPADSHTFGSLCGCARQPVAATEISRTRAVSKPAGINIHIISSNLRVDEGWN